MTLGIGLVGSAFMGAAHARAWRTAARFFDLPLEPELAVLCGRDADALAAAAASVFGLLARTEAAQSREILLVEAQDEFVSPTRTFPVEEV